MKTLFVTPQTAERSWFVIDAEGKPLGRVAAKVAYMLRGKHKPTYTPSQETGDFIVVVNADKIAVSGRKRQNKVYYHHTGFPGGLKDNTFAELLQRNPVAPLELAIRGMLPKGPLGRKLYKNAKIYAGPNHPHAAQGPVAIEL
ncbi:MAG TPA: 50S ribosomal protein L13 [Spirochaetales bacterium]|nr:50S ribosomal protein L13 [Spirochaetales bacterium]HRY54018.1 50S ribosomal protein L13 [Spirochaetia bacterium]HRZ65037.1 50S ribosomal protein L13 [Spirochaetia bacterium]